MHSIKLRYQALRTLRKIMLLQKTTQKYTDVELFYLLGHAIETVFFFFSLLSNISVNDYDMLGQALKIENLLRA